MDHFIKAFCIFLVCLFSSSTWGTEVKIGLTSISLPALDGFKEVSLDFPAIRKTAESFTPTDNRLLAVYLSDSDVAKAMRGEVIGFNRYVLIQTARKAERKRFTPDKLARLKPTIRQNLGANLETLSDSGKAVAGSLDEILIWDLIQLLHETKKPIFLNITTNTKTVIGGTMLSSQVNTINGTENSYVTVTNYTNLIVKKKLLFFYLYSGYQDKRDVEFVNRSAVDWIRKIEDANWQSHKISDSTVLIDFLIALVISLSVSVLPAYFFRYKVLRYPMSKGGAILFSFVSYMLIWLALAFHAQLSHPGVQSRPGYIFMYLVILAVWNIVRKEPSLHELGIKLTDAKGRKL